MTEFDFEKRSFTAIILSSRAARDACGSNRSAEYTSG